MIHGTIPVTVHKTAYEFDVREMDVDCRGRLSIDQDVMLGFQAEILIAYADYGDVLFRR